MLDAIVAVAIVVFSIAVAAGLLGVLAWLLVVATALSFGNALLILVVVVLVVLIFG